MFQTELMDLETLSIQFWHKSDFEIASHQKLKSILRTIIKFLTRPEEKIQFLNNFLKPSLNEIWIDDKRLHLYIKKLISFWS